MTQHLQADGLLTDRGITEGLSLAELTGILLDNLSMNVVKAGVKGEATT